MARVFSDCVTFLIDFQSRTGVGRLRYTLNEARITDHDPASSKAEYEECFHDMYVDSNLSQKVVRRRNIWVVWTGGNGRFWDKLSGHESGSFEVLKVASSRPGLKYSPDNRLNCFETLNGPCFEKVTGPKPQRFGLLLDERQPSADPFDYEQKHPGAAISARGDSAAVSSYYGHATGVMGLLPAWASRAAI